ncbi:PREDICTED: ly6/PLAUR domain-containing protein 3-like [Acanthisitta chloris]|uniref:ly6/PLAUR domain-containing protein 3-like n=1 Tax=Acanthisitta chloris TaxID=57068 RepID=UPI0004F0C824|nr:PREDICTED: ly6/PLAUR domain-containing protein 3-like [Acanthisitta chloris]
MMWTVYSLVLVSSLFVLKSEALQCYTCVGSSDDDCNRQGTQQCPGHADACAIIRGQASGIMKSCSFRSFCERARRDGSRAPGVSVQCCYSNHCNAKSLASRISISSSYFPLLIFTLLWHQLFKLT